MLEFRVRPLNPKAEGEVELLAVRMRETLIEVLGEERGRAMYSLAWLEERVLWHLNPEMVTGQVFVVESNDGEIVAHSIVRVEHEPNAGEETRQIEGKNNDACPEEADIQAEDNGRDVGLFSTTFVTPEFRRNGIASMLLQEGEIWMVNQGMTVAVTYTDEDNHKLQRLYLDHGYILSPMPDHFVKLEKQLLV